MNTTDNEKKVKLEILEAKDRVAASRHFQLFRQETGGWTRFDKLYDQSSDNEKKKLIDAVCIELSITKQYALDKANEEIVLLKEKYATLKNENQTCLAAWESKNEDLTFLRLKYDQLKGKADKLYEVALKYKTVFFPLKIALNDYQHETPTEQVNHETDNNYRIELQE